MQAEKRKSNEKELVNRQHTDDKKGEQAATGDNYKLPSENKVKEELREGVE